MEIRKKLFDLLSMRLLTWLGICSSPFVFTACYGTIPKDYVLDITPRDLTFGRDGGQQTIQIKSNSSWMITNYTPWIQTSTASGNGNQTVNVIASKNTTQEERSGYLLIITDDGYTSQTITIKQNVGIVNLPGTTWEDTNRYSDGSTFVVSLYFQSSTAARLSFISTESTSSSTQYIDYTYTQSEDGNLVVLRPNENGMAVMEWKIENGSKMTLTNTSNGSEVAVLYKK